jgi:AcrR family transcriptional regulator
MARPGAPSKIGVNESGRSTATRNQLIDAAIDCLIHEGFAGTSARSIGERANQNQALVFYHFGSVVNLLLVALDTVSERRMTKYTSAVEAAATTSELISVAMQIFREDLDAGYVTVLVEMMAGSSATTGLGAEVAQRIAPWFSFAEVAVERFLGTTSMIATKDAAYAIVAMYVGLEMLTHLEGDRGPALELFAQAQKFADLIGAFSTSGPTKGNA